MNITEREFNKKYNIKYIHSFVRRKSRLTKRQQQAINHYWSLMGVEFSNYLLNYNTLFGYNMPVTLEIGFGMGASLVTMAKMHPEQAFLGIEVYYPGIGSCLAMAHEEGVKNLRIIYHDAVEVMYKMIPNNSLSTVQLFFPDPWHKTRHNKRRIVQTAFAKLVKNKLNLGGTLYIVTDWQPYAEQILKVMSSLEGYKNQSVSNDYIQRPKSRPITKFEQRSYDLGHNVWNLMFKKIK